MTVVLHRGDRQLDADARAATRAALSIHRMHHAHNEACLDKDYGSVLITFDRLFTFAGPPREEPLRLGLKRREAGQNPFTNALGEWRKLLADIVHAPGLTAKLKTVFGAP
jgi:sterol desaturase/sphingolipid hydroxylase (fatty acid hydroxylase superfamily)